MQKSLHYSSQSSLVDSLYLGPYVLNDSEKMFESVFLWGPMISAITN
ncbi:Uncharacterised protein [Pseudomonas fluorescens]|uniref:Uncharacterized protein n=1 Tax=Pseudomonas fluorescens TaxID=294 RepID=A0A448DYB1_PSEFL|nr:Uncharacterised protein [Pseudomonas fluorescens]